MLVQKLKLRADPSGLMLRVFRESKKADFVRLGTAESSTGPETWLRGGPGWKVKA